MDVIELNDGTSISCKALEKAEYDSLLKKSDSTIYLDKYKGLYSLDVHLLGNGEVLIHESGYYTLYYRLSDLDRLLSQDNHSDRRELLLNKNVYGEKFPSHTKQLIDGLLQSLALRDSVYNDNLLLSIDNKINKLKNGDEFKKTHFINLIAVVGEVLLKKYTGFWNMELDLDGKTWNPYLTISGNKFQFFIYLYEDVFFKRTHEYTLSEINDTMQIIIANALK